jgi:flagellar protein FlbD
MIQLTRLNNHPLIVNSDLIKFVERAPDTVLTLVSGEKIVVLETSEQVLEKIVEFRRLVLSGTTLCSSNVPGAPTDEPPPGTGVGAG